MHADEVILQAHGLTRTFADGDRTVPILDGVSIALRRSELALLMGPSGSGKSTLLSVLSGLLAPTTGRVVVQGEDLWGAGESRRERLRQKHFGFIFQGCNLFPALTARQQLEIVLRWWGGLPAREARQRSERMLALLGLSSKMNLRPAELSGGEKQRVAVGRALVKQPALCFADEPTSALDWSNGEEVVSLLRSAARDQKTAVLMVSHDDRVKAYADRVFKLSDRCLLEQGYLRPASPEPASA
jgi:putative ABC transport system ATP-binding protein